MHITVDFDIPDKLSKKLGEMMKLWDIRHKSDTSWSKERVCAVILLDVLGNLVDRGHNLILGYETMHKSLESAYEERL